MWTQSKSLFLSRILVKVVFVLLIAAIFCIPVCADWYDAVSGHADPVFLPLCIVLYLSVALGFVLDLSLHRLLHNIAKQEVFTDANIRCLRVIAWCCFGVAILFAVLAFWRPLVMIVAFAGAFFGLILRVLKNVMEQAVRLREEQDYTI